MIDINIESKVAVFMASMYASGMFTDTKMNKWETAAGNSWAVAQAYFIKLYKKK